MFTPNTNLSTVNALVRAVAVSEAELGRVAAARRATSDEAVEASERLTGHRSTLMLRLSTQLARAEGRVVG